MLLNSLCHGFLILGLRLVIINDSAVLEYDGKLVLGALHVLELDLRLDTGVVVLRSSTGLCHVKLVVLHVEAEAVRELHLIEVFVRIFEHLADDLVDFGVADNLNVETSENLLWVGLAGLFVFLLAHSSDEIVLREDTCVQFLL